MKLCPNCNASNPDSARTCQECSMPLKNISSSKSATSKIILIPHRELNLNMTVSKITHDKMPPILYIFQR